MTTTIAPSGATALTDEMLARFDARAPVYDRDNRFLTQDFRGVAGVRVPGPRTAASAPGKGITVSRAGWSG